MPVLIEIKARCTDPERVRSVLASSAAQRVGLDRQIDVYFKVPKGRLKLRRGTIENNLIFYERSDVASPKRSDVRLYQSSDPEALGDLLTHALGVWRVVDKEREIYLDGEVKLHGDEVENLGSFVEIEVIDESGEADLDEMRGRCHEWMERLGVRQTDLVAQSYSWAVEKVENETPSIYSTAPSDLIETKD